MNDWQNETTTPPTYNPSYGTVVTSALPDQEPPRQQSSTKFCLLACGGCGCLMLLVFLGIGLFFYFMAQKVVTQIKTDLSREPAIQEHLGDVKSIWFNVEKMQKEGQGSLIFSVVGTKAEGDLYVEQRIGSNGQAQPVATKLVLSTGEVIPLEEEEEAGPEAEEEPGGIPLDFQ